LSLLFSEGQHLSPAFANGAFISEHGSWDRKPLERLAAGNLNPPPCADDHLTKPFSPRELPARI
jgi:glucose/arabinose dehydrogenase